MWSFNGNNKKAGVFIDLKEESYVTIIRDLDSDGRVIPKLLVPNYLMKRAKNDIEYGYKTIFLDKELIALIMEFRLGDVYFHTLIDIRTLEKVKTLKTLVVSDFIVLSSIDRDDRIIFETKISNEFKFLLMRILKQYREKSFKLTLNIRRAIDKIDMLLDDIESKKLWNTEIDEMYEILNKHKIYKD